MDAKERMKVIDILHKKDAEIERLKLGWLNEEKKLAQATELLKRVSEELPPIELKWVVDAFLQEREGKNDTKRVG